MLCYIADMMYCEKALLSVFSGHLWSTGITADFFMRFTVWLVCLLHILLAESNAVL